MNSDSSVPTPPVPPEKPAAATSAESAPRANSAPPFDPAPPDGSSSAAPARRRVPPRWGILVFLLLLVAMGVVSHLAARSGPPVKWIENDLDAALAQAAAERPRVFLYLYEPQDPVHLRNEREVFTQRWARDPLATVPCCRVAIGSDVRSLKLREKYGYRGTPLFLLLNRAGVAVSRTEGAADEREFSTYIGSPLSRSAGQREGE